MKTEGRMFLKQSRLRKEIFKTIKTEGRMFLKLSRLREECF